MMTSQSESKHAASADLSLAKTMACARAALEKKAENVKILELSDLSGFTDFFLVASGTSDRQVQAIADSVQSVMEGEGFETLTVEGYSEGRWVLIDFGDVVVHVFLDALREYYDLEGLWATAPRVKIPSEFYGPAGTRLN
jgi:ribosome silencing factor RsfS/YbeB/iojap